jgi:hypothetical protein
VPSPISEKDNFSKLDKKHGRVSHGRRPQIWLKRANREITLNDVDR